MKLLDVNLIKIKPEGNWENKIILVEKKKPTQEILKRLLNIRMKRKKPFFDELVTFMTRCPIIVAVLEKKNAVEDFRRLIGSTNPEKAEKGTVRKLFAKSMGENAIHGSDSLDNALIESSFFFASREMF